MVKNKKKNPFLRMSQEIWKIKTNKKSGLTNKEIFEKAGGINVNREYMQVGHGVIFGANIGGSQITKFFQSEDKDKDILLSNIKQKQFHF